MLTNNKSVMSYLCAENRIFRGTQHNELVFAASYSLFKDKILNHL